ncbi:hypothetical protein BAMTA208_01565 [Bacillus amyloliquefaciens TA208]|nr:hypothetical protein BAMTA208_01565 [Bacillus amyloliquefaciens TA208]
MRHTEKNSDKSRGIFAASRNLFSKNIIYVKLKIFKL